MLTAASLPAAQWAEARDILAAAESRTADAVWACGPFLAQHASAIAGVWSGKPLVYGQPTDGSMCGVGRFEVRSNRFTIAEYATVGAERVRLTIPVAAVERLVADRLSLPAGVLADVDAVLADRRAVSVAQLAHNDRYLESVDPPTVEERDALSARYAAVERRCVEVGARVWECVRPRMLESAQLDLFATAVAA